MRLGVISDVHGNLPALEATIGSLEREGVDQLLCLGDIVGYGPFPNACVQRVRALNACIVAGNHDLMASGAAEIRVGSSLARDTLLWTKNALGREEGAWLASLPLVCKAASALVMTHGGLGDPWHYVRTGNDAHDQLRQLRREHPAAQLLLVGHTHISMAYGERGQLLVCGGSGRVRLPQGRFLLNPGSVGQSRQWPAVARALLLDLDANVASFTAVEYDVTSTKAELLKNGLPLDACHRRPSKREAAEAAVQETGRALRRTWIQFGTRLPTRIR